MPVRLPRIPDRVFHILMALLVLALVVGVVRLVLLLGEESGVELAEATDAALSVPMAVERATGEPLPVRGFVFIEPGHLAPNLCFGRQRGEPPRCQGPFVSLRYLDVHRLDLTVADSPDGEVRYTRRPVVLYGEVRGLELAVREILSD